MSQSLQRAFLHTSNVESVDSKLKVTCWVGVKADQDNLQCAPITIENRSQSMFIIERNCSCEASSRSSDISYQSQTLYLTILYPSLLYRSLLALAHNIALHNLIGNVYLDDRAIDVQSVSVVPNVLGVFGCLSTRGWQMEHATNVVVVSIQSNSS